MPVILNPIVRSSLVTARTHGRLMREILYREMVDHLQKRIPKHFVTGADRVYHMRPRTRKYVKRKLRVKGHNRPLVWSGRTERDLIASKHRITRTQKQARLYYKNYFPLKDNQRKEIEIVLEREKAEMARNLGRNYKQECNNPLNQTKRRRR